MSRFATTTKNRREFLKTFGLGAAVLPYLGNLSSFAGEATTSVRKRRLIVIFSPNGIVKKDFWPDTYGPDFELKRILEPLAPWKEQTLLLKGVCDQVKGDGDNHMRGIGCLLTGTELFPGNIQGGSHTPAGWSTGHSVDQEIKWQLQKNEATRTRFGSLEFGVLVPERADTWTRMVYEGANKPIAPIDDPYVMFKKLYGQMKDREHLGSVLDSVQTDLAKVRRMVSDEDRKLLDEHETLIREMERELAAGRPEENSHPVPELELGVIEQNDNLPKISCMQMDLLYNSLRADFTRIATMQFTNSVGTPRMKWLGVEESHHELSHRPNSDKDAQEKLVKINRWYCEQIAYLVKRLADTPESGSNGSMLDHTTIVWTNELGEGNSHTLNDIPFVLIGGGLGFQMGRALDLKRQPHNRLLLSLANGMGHEIERFGNADFCGDGPLTGLV